MTTMTRVLHAFARALTNRRPSLCMRIQLSSSGVQAQSSSWPSAIEREIEGRRGAGAFDGNAIVVRCGKFGFELGVQVQDN